MDPPPLPPAYLSDALLHSPMEPFEVEDAETAPKPRSLLSTIVNASQNTFRSLHHNVLASVMRVVDPFREGIAVVDRTYELFILKLGNPLVVKRLLYISFVVVLMNSLYYAERNDGVKGISSGGFTDGKLFYIDLLGNSLRQYIDPLVLKEDIEYVSSVSRLPGTVGDLAIARYFKSYLANNRIKSVLIDEHDTYINYPAVNGSYIRLADGTFEATLTDSLLDGADYIQRLAFNPDALATDGEIEAPYIFANYGEESDFARLSDAGIPLNGCILLVKYGGNLPESRKLVLAHELGAQAVVFISLSSDWTGANSDEHINRWGVGNTRYGAGDLLDPFWTTHLADARNLDWAASGAAPQIPLIPVCWKDGKYLIDQLGKDGIRYEDGPFSGTSDTSKCLKLKIALNGRRYQSIWNVFGSILGREQASKGIIFGAPRDSTCFGASTSATSTAVLLSLAKVLTSLQRQYDWSPSRSIHFVSFDATDYNVAGSALWVKERKKELFEQGYTYIEVSDIYLGDILTVAANPLLHSVLLEELDKVAIEPAHFGGAQNLYQLYVKQHGKKSTVASSFLENKNYMPFINSLNMPAIDVGFRAKDPARQPIHSCLDLFENLDKHRDGKMEHQVAMTELLARLGLRLAEEPIIPFDLSHFSTMIAAYNDDLQKLLDEHLSMRGIDLKELNRATAKLLQGAQSLEDFKQEWRDFVKSSDVEPVMLANTRRFANENVVTFNRLFVASNESLARPECYNFLTGTPHVAPPYSNDGREWNSFPFVRDALLMEDAQAAAWELERLTRTLAHAAELLVMYR